MIHFRSINLAHLCILNIEKNGKTLHLLKANSKPIPTKLKRRKIQLLGTYKEYAESKKKPVPVKDPIAQSKPPVGSGQIQGNGILQFMAPAPNAKDAKMN